ncbi:MAG: hypothetical protein KKF57_09350, partial [Firmicutes bacterium]|nr:hypothetical protein [Bacillota bacterium]
IPKLLTKIAKILTVLLLTNKNTRGAVASGAIQNLDMDCRLCLAVVFFKKSYVLGFTLNNYN